MCSAQENRGGANRTMPLARGGKNGIYDENVRQRNIFPPVLRHAPHHSLMKKHNYATFMP